jgi:hypothetical protein
MKTFSSGKDQRGDPHTDTKTSHILKTPSFFATAVGRREVARKWGEAAADRLPEWSHLETGFVRGGEETRTRIRGRIEHGEVANNTARRGVARCRTA